VVNFELPNVPEDYVHRIGRTGRAGASGEAISLICAEETSYVKSIEKLLGQRLKTEIVEGFEPTETDFSPPKKNQGNRRNNNSESRSKKKNFRPSNKGQNSKNKNRRNSSRRPNK